VLLQDSWPTKSSSEAWPGDSCCPVAFTSCCCTYLQHRRRHTGSNYTQWLCSLCGVVGPPQCNKGCNADMLPLRQGGHSVCIAAAARLGVAEICPQQAQGPTHWSLPPSPAAVPPLFPTPSHTNPGVSLHRTGLSICRCLLSEGTVLATPTHLLQCPASCRPARIMSDPSCLKEDSSCGRWSPGHMLGL
jgi:hypothetical protein